MKKNKFFTKVIFFYVSLEFLLSFSVGFLVVFILFFINQMLVEIGDLLAQDISLYNSVKLVFYASPVFIAFTYPFASLLGTIFAVGRFSNDNEIVAFQTLGIGMVNFFYPFVFWSVLITGLSFFTHNYLMPIGLQKFREELYRISQESPEVIFKPYSITNVDRSLMIIPDVDEKGAKGILIIDHAENGESRIINSTRAKLLHGEANSSYISMSLGKSFILTPKNYQNYSYSFANSVRYNMLFDVISKSVSRVHNQEKSVFEIKKEIENIKAKLKESKLVFDFNKNLKRLNYFRLSIKKSKGVIVDENILKNDAQYIKNIKFKNNSSSLQSYMYGFWQKIYQPLMSLIFIFFGLAVGIFLKRSGKGVSIGVGGAAGILYLGMDAFLSSFVSDNLDLNVDLVALIPIVFFIFLSIILLYFRFKR